MDAPLQEKLNAIEILRESYSVHMLCEVYDIPRGTYYNHVFRSKLDKELRAAVDSYIDWYNIKRPHAKLHYKTPLAKENEFYSCKNDL